MILAGFVFLLVWLVVWTLGGALLLKWCLNRSATRSLQIALLIVWFSQTGAFAVACVRFGWHGFRFYTFLIYALLGTCVFVYRKIRLSRMSADELLAFLQKQELIAAKALCTTPLLQDYEDPDADCHGIATCHGKQVACEDTQYNQVVSHTEHEHQGDCENQQSSAPRVMGTNAAPGPRVTPATFRYQCYSSDVSPGITQIQSQPDAAPVPIRLFAACWLVGTWLPAQILIASVFAGLV